MNKAGFVQRIPDFGPSGIADAVKCLLDRLRMGRAEGDDDRDERMHRLPPAVSAVELNDKMPGKRADPLQLACGTGGPAQSVP
jgi:hypothetical protein